MTSPYLTAKEAAEYLRITRGGLYAAIEAGLKNSAGEVIPFTRRGRAFLFDRSALESWLNPQTGGRSNSGSALRLATS